MTLVDPQARQFVAVLAGTPGKDGKLSQESWQLNDAMTASGGRFVFKGSANVPEGVLRLAYLVPSDAKGLALKDGTASHPLGVD